MEVQGQVSRVLGATTVTLAEARGGRELLVFHVDAVPALDDVGDGDRTPSGDLVRVEGRLRPLHHSDFERTLGELDRSRYMAFEGRPAMIADVVNPGYR